MNDIFKYLDINPTSVYTENTLVAYADHMKQKAKVRSNT